VDVAGSGAALEGWPLSSFRVAQKATTMTTSIDASTTPPVHERR
jgi:hypothetical protein